MKKPFYKRWWFIVIVAIFALAVIGAAVGDDETADNDEKAETINTSTTNSDEKAPEQSTNEQKQEEKADNDIPREYKAALNKAELYAETMYMSKQGIYDQLVSEYGEGFPPEAAQYAIDNLDWDWKANALKKAEQYAETMNMSNQSIYEQLISEYGEKFTHEEAQYAIDNLK